MKGVLFKEPLFRSTVAGTKTETRREFPEECIINQDPDRYKFHGFDDKGRALFEDLKPEITPWISPIPLRYKKEETIFLKEPYVYRSKHDKVYYKFDWPDFEPYAHDGWKNKMFMPQKYARHYIEILDVKVERLNDITNQGAVAEGVEKDREGWKSYDKIYRGHHKGADHPFNLVPYKLPTLSYRSLWESINGENSWEKNPWIIVYKYKFLR